MPDQETYTKEELEKKSRLHLRRICKELGMSSEDCAQAHYEDLVNWIMEQQDGGEEPEKPAKRTTKAASKKKTSTKKAPDKASGKEALAAKRGKTSKKVTAKKPAAKDPDPDPDTEDDGVVHADEMAAIETAIAKIDEMGTVVNANFEELSAKVDAQVEENFNLQTELYKTQGMLVHLMSWLEAEGIITEDGAPEELMTEDKLTALAAECEGNDEGE